MPSNAFHRQTGDGGDGAPIYLASVNDLRETGRAIGISLLGVEPAGPGLFLPAPSAESPRQSWTRWLEEGFEARLGEPFIEIFLAAGEMRNRRIAGLDRTIDSGLSEAERHRSLTAAVPFFEGTGEIRRLPQWTRFLARIEDGTVPGHVTSLFALRSAVFHLPLLPALVSYLYFEWKSGLAAAETSGTVDLSPVVFQADFPEGIQTAKRIFDARSGQDRLASI